MLCNCGKGARVFKGIVLLVLGVMFLLHTLGFVVFPIATWWPLFLIMIGIVCLVGCNCKK